MDKLFEEAGDGTFVPAPDAKVMQTAAELAALELSRRGADIGPEELKPLVKAFLAKHDHELLCAAYLDAGSRLIEFKIVGEGSQVQVETNLRETVKAGITNTAYGVVMIHNHPGGVAKPSKGDVQATGAMKVALALFQMRLLDAWVVSGDEVYSFREHDKSERIPSELGLLAALLGIKPPKPRDDSHDEG